jgi:hypothetical protein
MSDDWIDCNADKQVDIVNDPQHYKQHEMECIDEMVEVFGPYDVMAFCRCNAWKYRYRAPYKGKLEEDNEKADWYIQKLKELSRSVKLGGAECTL